MESAQTIEFLFWITENFVIYKKGTWVRVNDDLCIRPFNCEELLSLYLLIKKM